MSSQVTLQIKADTRQAAAEVRALNAEVKKAFAQIRETVAAASAELRELTFNPGRIVEGAEQAVRGIDGVKNAAKTAAQGLRTVQAEATQAGADLKTVGVQAAGAEKKLGTLAGTSAAVETALGDMGAAAAGADAALDGLDAGAAVAQKSVAGLGRAAASTLPKLDALSGAAFDPAKIVAGADTGTAALGRLKAAAASVRGALRGASGAGLPPVFGGGRRIGGGPDEAPLTFGQGLRSGAGVIGDLGSGAAALTTLVAAVTGKLSATFDNMLQGVKGNTTESAADMAAMRAQVLSLMKTGTSSEELAQGYKHIQNFGYHGAEAAKIAEEGNRFGIATHTNVEETDDVGAGIMNAYQKHGVHLGADAAPRIFNTIHFAAAGSNMDIGKLEKNSTRTVGLAAAYMGEKGLPDVLAAYSALVQHRMSPARADTQVSGMLGQIAAPSPKALKEADKLGLTHFNASGLRDVQLSGVIEEVKSKIKALPVNDQATALRNLFNNKQGATGVTFLTGAAEGSYHKALNDPHTGTKAAFAGKADAITPLYNAQMKQTTQAFKALSGEIQADFIPIGEKMGPVFVAAIPLVRGLANILKSLMDGFTRLPKPAQEAVLAIGGLKLLSSFLPLLSGFSILSEKTGVVLGTLGKMLLGVAPAAAEGEAGIAGIGGVIGGPFLLGMGAAIAIVGGLTLAWRKDFGGIREFVGAQVKQIVGFFRSEMPQIQQTVKTVLATIAEFWHSHGSRIMAIVRPLWNIIKSTVVNALHIIENVVKLVLAVINGDWSTAGSALKGIVGSLWSEIKSLFSNGVKAVGNILAGIVELLIDLGKRAFAAGAHLGDSIVTGIKNGITAKMGQVASAAHALGTMVINAGKAALDSHSPSRKMHQLGLDAAQGLTNGLSAGQAGVGSAATRLSDLVWKRFQIRHAARMSGKEAGSPREQIADRQDYQLTSLTAQAADARGAVQQDAHRFDRSFDNQSAEDTHIHAKWEARLADNASYQKYLEDRKKQLEEWGKAHQAWLTTHEAGARRFATIEGRIDTSIQQLTGRMADAKTKAADMNAEIAASLGAMDDDGPNKYSRMFGRNDDDLDKAKKTPGVDIKAATELWTRNKAAITAAQTTATNEAGDKKMDWEAQNGEASLQAAADYYQKRQALLETAGEKYSSEWYEIAGRVKDVQRSITDAEQQSMEVEKQSLRERLDALREQFQSGGLSADKYRAALANLSTEIVQFTKADPKSAPGLEAERHEIATTVIKQNKGEMVGGAEFWDGLASSAAENGSKVLSALLHPKDSKSIFKGMWTDLMSSLETDVTSQFSKMIKNYLTDAFSQGGAGTGGTGGGSLTSAISSLSTSGAVADPGMSAGAGGGGLSGLGGLMGGGGGGAMGGIGAAMPWVAAALAVHQIAPGFLGKIFGGWLGKVGPFKKLFKFANGGRARANQLSMFGEDGPELGILPQDMHIFTAPQTRRLLSPQLPSLSLPGATRSSVSNGGQVAAGGTVVHMHGDNHYHSEMDVKRVKRAWASDKEHGRRRMVPAT